MSNTMFNSTHPVNLLPAIGKIYGLEYEKLPKTFERVFEMATSKRAFEEDTEMIGFGLAQTKNQGGGFSRDSLVQGYTTRASHIAYGLRFDVSKEAKDDGQVFDVVNTASSELAKAFHNTKNVHAANVLNRGWNSAYSFGDGKELIASDHPTASGNQSNLLTAADLSEDSLEDMVIEVLNTKNSRGIKINVMPKDLIIPTAEIYNAHRILKSVSRVGVADNDTNALKDLNHINSIIEMRHLTDDDAFFMTTDVKNGLKMYMRTPIMFDQDKDINTLNDTYIAYERYSFTCSDWRSIRGSQGAA